MIPGEMDKTGTSKVPDLILVSLTSSSSRVRSKQGKGWRPPGNFRQFFVNLDSICWDSQLTNRNNENVMIITRFIGTHPALHLNCYLYT